MSKNKEIVEKSNAAFAEGKPEDFLALCAEDMIWNIRGEKNIAGKRAIRDFMNTMQGELPEFTVDGMIEENDSVVCFGDMTMKQEDGETSTYSYCDVYQLIESEIVRLHSFVVKHKTAGESERKAAA